MNLLARSNLCLGLCFFLSAPLFSQINYKEKAHKIVDTLAAPGMHGRGYVMRGDSIAAAYIAGEFKKSGLLSFGSNYYQSLSFPVNTFPGKMEVKFDGKLLVPGKDFIIRPSSTTTSRSFDIWVYSSKKINRALESRDHLNELQQDLKDKIIYFEDEDKEDKLRDPVKRNSEIKAGGIAETEVKLTWGVSKSKEPFPGVIVLKEGTRKPKSISIDIESKFFFDYETQNVIGYLKGTRQPDSFMVFSAHYDHLGRMGKDTYFPGANDNASGIAMLLSLADHFSKNPPPYSVVFIAFAGEEAGLVGSKYFTEKPLFPLKNIRFLVNMDIMGTGDEGIKVVNATEFRSEFELMTALNGTKQLLPSVQPRGKAAISDHHFFTEAGVRCFFIYTLGGIKAYHDIYDRPETLPLTKFNEAFELLRSFSESIMKQ